jgi:hypothetical protein
MDIRKLANILFIGGMILVVVALGWWSLFFGEIARQMGNSLSDVFECLYSNEGRCGLIIGYARMKDLTVFGPSYSPFVFWIGAVGMIVGGIMHASMKPQPGTPAV